jgi:hypothetical protein
VRKGSKLTEEHRAKISASLRGNRNGTGARSEEARRNISEGQRRIQKSAAHRARISSGVKRYWEEKRADGAPG